MRCRSKPNILVTGTPGTGKSTLCQQVAQVATYSISHSCLDDRNAQNIGFTHIDVSQLACEEGLGESMDEARNCLIIDEDQVCDSMEDRMNEGGCLVDYHSCDFFPEKWFDLVLVLQTDNTLLYDRLEKRGYDQEKIQENVTCEIMQIILEEARDSYSEEIIKEVKSDTVEELENAVENLCQWIRANVN